MRHLGRPFGVHASGESGFPSAISWTVACLHWAAVGASRCLLGGRECKDGRKAHLHRRPEGLIAVPGPEASRTPAPPLSSCVAAGKGDRSPGLCSVWVLEPGTPAHPPPRAPPTQDASSRKPSMLSPPLCLPLFPLPVVALRRPLLEGGHRSLLCSGPRAGSAEKVPAFAPCSRGQLCPSSVDELCAGYLGGPGRGATITPS